MLHTSLKNINIILSLISLLLSSHCYSANFNANNTSYLFAPGLNSYENQVVRYLPEFTTITGEKISCKTGIHVINEQVTICKFPEIKLQSTQKGFINPIEWSTSKLIILRNKLCEVQITDTDPKGEFTINGHATLISKINLAQEADINALIEAYNDHVTKYPNTNIVAFGTSRGAATTFNAIAQNKLPQVKIVVLEGIFDSIPHLLKHKYKATYKIVRSIISKLTSYKKNGISPDKFISIYPKDRATLLVSSEKDKIVPFRCTKRLYEKLKKAGCTVYFLPLKNASHSGYCNDDQQDKYLYETVLHAFYKHCGHAHDPKLAELGYAEWQKILNQ